jgi:antirepressor protein
VAVRLEDGRIGAVLRSLCEGLGLDTNAQLQRIRRKAALADGLLMVRVETAGGPQAMPALLLDLLPGWFLSIDERRFTPERRAEVIQIQREAVKALSGHFVIELPDRRAYHRDMPAWLNWQDDMDRWNNRR